MEQLSGFDSAFLFLEDKTRPMHAGGFIIYDPATAPGGQISFEQIMANLVGRIASSRSLRRRLVRVPFDLDNPWWADDDVDLRDHVRRLALPAPAGWRELCEQVAVFMARPLDMARPLWELCVIEGLVGIEGLPDGAFAVALKVHHSCIDGVAGMELLSAIHDTDPEPEPPVSVPARATESPSMLELLGRALPNAALKPLRLLGLSAGKAGPVLYRRVTGANAGPEPEPAKIPHTRFNGALGPHRTVGGVRFDLADVKIIKNAVPGATVNDVVLALIGGGLRRYLQAAQELPAESLVALMPISVRGEQDTDGSGNKLTLTVLPLGTDVGDPLERVRFVHETATRKKAVRDGEGAGRLMEIADSIPAGMMGLAGRLMSVLDLTDRMSVANVSVTNVPGPTTPLYMSGARMLDIYGLALATNGLGLVNMLSSYCGRLTVGFQAGSEMVPDPESYEDCLRASFAELFAAASGPGRRNGSPTSRPAGRTRPKAVAASRQPAARPD